LKFIYLVPFAVLAVILVTAGTVIYVVPRTDLRVRIVYHETPGGGGTGGIMNINVVLDNRGNRDISGLDCGVSVTRDGRPVSADSVADVSLPPGDIAEVRLVIIGSQYYTYSIISHIRFECRGQTYMADLSCVTVEDEMNQVFDFRVG